MSYPMTLLNGLAVDLDALDVGVWNPAGAYTATERGIVQHRLPQDPPEIVALALYNEEQVSTYRRDVESVVTFVQIRLRVLDPDEGVDLQARIRDRYHRRRVVLAGMSVTGRQQSIGPLGTDENDRSLFTQNFTFTGLRART